MPTGAVKRRDKLLSMMQLHCLSDLQITMEIVFLRFPHCPASRFSSGGKAESAESGCGGRTATFSQRCCSRTRQGLSPLKAEGVKSGREDPAGKGESVSVSHGAALCPLPPRSAAGGGAGVCHGRRLAGSGPLASPGWWSVGLPLCLRRRKA